MVSPDIANAPYRHHVACCHPTVRTPARHAATSSDIKPADSHAQLAEKALIAPKVKAWLQPQRAQAPAARRKRCCSGAAKAASCEARELRALRAREVAWRHAGSTRNEVRSKVQAVAAEVQLAEKRGDAPLVVPNQRVHVGVVQLDLVAHVERDERRLAVDVDRSGRRDRDTRLCAHTLPHKHAQNSDGRLLRREAI